MYMKRLTVSLLLALGALQTGWAAQESDSIPVGVYSDSEFPSDGSLPAVRPWMQRHSAQARAASQAREHHDMMTLKQQLDATLLREKTLTQDNVRLTHEADDFRVQATTALSRLQALQNTIAAQQKEDEIQRQAMLKVRQDNDALNSQLTKLREEASAKQQTQDDVLSEQKKQQETLTGQLTQAQQTNTTLSEQLDRARANAVPVVTLQSDDEQTAYAAGQNYARALGQTLATQRSAGVTLLRPQLIAGLTDGLAHHNLLSAEKMAALTTALDQQLNAHLQQQQVISQTQARVGEAFYARFAKEKGVQSATEGKALYQVQAVGQGPKVKESDTVDILLTGRLPDGTVFDDSGLKKRLQRVKADSILPALTYGLTLAGKGGHVKVVLPPEEGFGAEGVPPSIPGNATLIFDVQIIGISPQ